MWLCKILGHKPESVYEPYQGKSFDSVVRIKCLRCDWQSSRTVRSLAVAIPSYWLAAGVGCSNKEQQKFRKYNRIWNVWLRKLGRRLCNA